MNKPSRVWFVFLFVCCFCLFVCWSLLWALGGKQASAGVQDRAYTEDPITPSQLYQESKAWLDGTTTDVTRDTWVAWFMESSSTHQVASPNGAYCPHLQVAPQGDFRGGPPPLWTLPIVEPGLRSLPQRVLAAQDRPKK